MAVIALEQVAKNFGAIKIIDRLDLRIEDGEFVIFVGPSGSGKSTLLRLIAGLEDCSSGRVFIDGIDVTDMGPAERALSMVFQSYALYPTKTVRGNMSFGLEVARLPKPEIDRRVNAAAAALRLEALMERKPKALSGGQRQRVAIGRAIVREPVAFLFDEPLSNLDAALRVEMRIEIAKLHQRLNATMIYVTHDQVEAMTLADKIVVLDKGEIQQVGSPMQLYDQPANLFVAQFIGSPKMNVLEAKTEAGGFRLPVADGFVPSDNPPPAVAKIAIRPEDIALASPGDHHVLGVVDVVERLGSDTYAYVSVGNAGVLTVRIVGNAAWIAVGATVGLVFATNRLHLFDDSGKAIQA